MILLTIGVIIQNQEEIDFSQTFAIQRITSSGFKLNYLIISLDFFAANKPASHIFRRLVSIDRQCQSNRLFLTFKF